MKQENTKKTIFLIPSTFLENPLTEKTNTKNAPLSTVIFSNTILSNIKFSDCLFDGCNLSLATLFNTAFRDIKFNNCKMLGLHFENCSEAGLSVYFDNCILTHSSFYKLKLKKNNSSKIQDLKELIFQKKTDLSLYPFSITAI